MRAMTSRPVVAEQVESLGGKFIKIDIGETGQTKDGYAKELTDEQKAKQQEAQRDAIADSDIVITTAQLFGRKPPVLIQRYISTHETGQCGCRYGRNIRW